MSPPAAASSSCTFLPSLPVRGGPSAKRLVARAKVNSTGFWTPDAVVPNYDIWSIRKDLEVSVSAFLGDSTRAQGGQGPPSMLVERFQSVIMQLFQQRIIRCGGAGNFDMANLIVAQLLYLDAADPNRVCSKSTLLCMTVEALSQVECSGAACLKSDIASHFGLHLFGSASIWSAEERRNLFSPGSVQISIFAWCLRFLQYLSGMAIFDTLRHIRPDVSTVCVGLAARLDAVLELFYLAVAQKVKDTVYQIPEL